MFLVCYPDKVPNGKSLSERKFRLSLERKVGESSTLVKLVFISVKIFREKTERTNFRHECPFKLKIVCFSRDDYDRKRKRKPISPASVSGSSVSPLRTKREHKRSKYQSPSPPPQIFKEKVVVYFDKKKEPRNYEIFYLTQ